MMATGLEPRDFRWVIAGRLAVSERIGGYGFQHRRVRRSEEIAWLKGSGVTGVLSLLSGGQNIASYETDDLDTYEVPIPTEYTEEDVVAVWAAIDLALEDQDAVLLVHRDIVDDTVAGLLGGYLVHSGLVDDPILATSLIQEIVGRPLGPEGRRLIPESAKS